MHMVPDTQRTCPAILHDGIDETPPNPAPDRLRLRNRQTLKPHPRARSGVIKHRGRRGTVRSIPVIAGARFAVE